MANNSRAAVIRQVALAGYERAYTRSFFAVLSHAGAKISSMAASGTHLQTLLNSVTDLVAKPVLEVYEKLFYDVELEFGKQALLEVLGSSKSAALPSFTKDPNEWDIWDPFASQEMQQWNTNRTSVYIKAISTATRDAIRRTVQAALDAGSDNEVIARKLRDQYAFSMERATRIAQTEINSAQNAASHFALTKFADPNSLVKSWLATGDRRTRPSHARASANQKDVPFNDAFEVGSSRLMFPGDSSLGASPKEIIRCRCTTTYGRNPNYKPPTPTQPAPAPTPAPTAPIVPGPSAAPLKPIPPSQLPIWQVPKGTTPLRIPLATKAANSPLRQYLDVTFEQAPEDLRLAINGTRKLQLFEQNTSGSYYQPGKHSISIKSETLSRPERRNHVFAHEYGHHMDYTQPWNVLTERDELGHRQIVKTSRADHGLADGIASARAQIDAWKSAGAPEYTRLKGIGREYLAGAQSEVAVADILGTLTYGEIGSGHSVEYYNRPTGADSEIVAQLIALYRIPRQREEEWKFLTKYFPDLVADFRAFISHAAKMAGGG